MQDFSTIVVLALPSVFSSYDSATAFPTLEVQQKS